MTTTHVLILVALVIGGYVLYHHKREMASDTTINSDSTSDKAETLGFVDTSNPAPKDIVSNKPFGSDAKGYSFPGSKSFGRLTKPIDKWGQTVARDPNAWVPPVDSPPASAAPTLIRRNSPPTVGNF